MVDIRVMQASDLPACYLLSQQLAWPHRQEDWALALKLGQGFVIKIRQKTIGSALYWQWGEHWASIGLVIVDATYRKQGFGKLLLTQIVDAVGPRSIRLSATQAGEPLYSKLGFTTIGWLTQLQIASLPLLERDFAIQEHAIFTAELSHLSSLRQVEYQSCGLDRPRLLQELLMKGRVRCARTASGQMIGFAACHRFGRGYVIGPVYAESLSVAKKLITDQFYHLGEQMVRVDCVNLELGKWLATMGLIAVDSSILMQLQRKKELIPTTVSKLQQFTLATQAFG